MFDWERTADPQPGGPSDPPGWGLDPPPLGPPACRTPADRAEIYAGPKPTPARNLRRPET